MRYLPHTEQDVTRMLEAVGVASVADLFSAVPASLRATAGLALDDGLDEQAVLGQMQALASENTVGVSFQGAGCYRHFVPALVGHILQRSEFATAYTPYQPEVSQGTLQACFEFQTCISILTGLEVANASLYDGASAFAEAVLMALRIGRKRTRVLVSEAIHPEYVEVARTYLEGSGRGELVLVPWGPDGRVDSGFLEQELAEDVAAVCVGYPNVFGVIDDLATASRLAKRAGALSICATSEPMALGLLRSPGELGADIAIAEGQSFGLSPSYGGPGLGLMAASARYVRQMPGRLVGETVDEEGRRGYVLTLATREQHIRREKATSNICTNQGLAALAATVFLALAGRRGLRRIAAANTVRAHSLVERLCLECGAEPVFDGHFFHEAALRVADLKHRFDNCVQDAVFPGVPLSRLFPGRLEFEDVLLVTATESVTDAECDLLVESLGAGQTGALSGSAARAEGDAA